jgi:pimeloyl-ACP methyl ester carboxylesterase
MAVSCHISDHVKTRFFRDKGSNIMQKTRIEINRIPALVWGEKSDKVYLCVHGKMSSKESAEGIAKIAAQRAYQTVSFDLPGHGERIHEDKRCDIWNGIHDLTAIGDYVFANWKEVSLCTLAVWARISA